MRYLEWLKDHQMAIEEGVRELGTETLDHCRSNGQIWDKMSIELDW